MNKWAEYLKAQFLGPVIRIDNKGQYDLFRTIIEKLDLEGHEYFNKYSYEEQLSLIKLNYRGKDFVKSTNDGKSFLIEYSYRGGFVASPLDAYDHSRYDETEWEIVPFLDMLKYIKGGTTA